jgi:hypothetical protein
VLAHDRAETRSAQSLRDKAELFGRHSSDGDAGALGAAHALLCVGAPAQALAVDERFDRNGRIERRHDRAQPFHEVETGPITSAPLPQVANLLQERLKT